ncbi:MAG: class I SAM-dependent methyltransferase [Candidatus Binatia bacterium]
MAATDDFYWSEDGFEYPEARVTEWVRRNIMLPKEGRVLDLCCGDGIWSRGIRNAQPNLEMFGIDLSEGGINKARRLLESDNTHFIVGDAETELPWPDGFFDVVFARGPGLYNQHSMDRAAAIAVIEMWHDKLTADSRFYSIFSSNPQRMGTYTPPEEVKLPYNRCSRQSAAVDFRGGKYHHTIESFLTPFWKAKNVTVERYLFFDNLHMAVTRLKRT